MGLTGVRVSEGAGWQIGRSVGSLAHSFDVGGGSCQGLPALRSVDGVQSLFLGRERGDYEKFALFRLGET